MMNPPLRILCIEGRQADFQLLERHLRQHGIEAECRRIDNREDLEAALADEDWHLVFSDHHLPGLAFEEILRILEPRLAELPLILVSSSVGEERAVELLKRGIWDFVLKEKLARLVPAIERSLRDAADRRARRESEERYRRVFEGESDAILLVDWETGKFLDANPAALRLYGYTLEEMLRLNSAAVSAEPDEPVPAIPPRDGKLALGWQRRKDGTRFPVEISGGYFESCGRQIHVRAIRDLSERHGVGECNQAEQALRDTERKRLEAFRNALLSLGRKLNITREPLEAGRALLDAADQLWKWDAASLDLFTSGGREVEPVLRVDLIGGERRELHEFEVLDAPTPRMERVAKNGPELILRESGSLSPIDSVSFGDTSRLSAAVMCVPVRREAQTVGVLSIQSYTPHAYTADDVQILQALADYCGGALDRIRSVEKLRQSEERFRSLYENAVMGLYRTTPDGRIVMANQALLQMLAYSSLEDLAKRDLEQEGFEPEYPRAEFKERMERDGQINGLETAWRRRDGTVVFVRENCRAVRDANGAIRFYDGSTEDVTERKRTEEALRQSEYRLQMALKAANMGTWEMDLMSPEHNISWSERYGALFGLPGAQIPANERSFLERVHHEDRELVRRSFSRAIQEADFFQCEFRVFWPDGAVHWHAAMGSAMRGDRGRPNRMVGVGMDVTERRHLEAQLRQSQKLEAVGQLAGGVAHDFNNVLAAILMQLGLLREDCHLTPNMREGLKDLEAEAQRAATLTRQLLMFSRRSILDVKVLNLNALVDNLLKMLRRLIGEHIELEFSPGPALPAVEADPGMLEQVLMNLAVNARDAMPRGGTIAIHTNLATIDASKAQANPEMRPGEFVCLAVTDTGCGMDASTLKRVFEPFFTTKEAGKGTGLGLATVHGIVGQHKGWVEVESAIGKGSTFRVLLPASGRAAESQAGAKNLAIDALRGTGTILLVEDELTVRRIAAQFLRLLGYKVLEAANGHEALGVWEKEKAEVVLLLTDMVMPNGMTGIELAERLQAEKPQLKVIISSGYSSEIVQLGRPAHLKSRYLPKPYEAKTLGIMIRSCLSSGNPGS